MSQHKEVLIQYQSAIKCRPYEEANYKHAFNAYYAIAQTIASQEEKIEYLKDAIKMYIQAPYIQISNKTIDLPKLYDCYKTIYSHPATTQQGIYHQHQLLHDLERYVNADSSNWYKKKDIMEVAIDLSHTLLEIHKDDMICSLGHSPSWAIKIAQINSNIIGSDKAFKYIPFSGRFCKAIDSSPPSGEKIFIENPPIQEIKHIEQYHSMLNDMDLSPDSIVSRYKQHHTKTAIVDYVESGGGLASFLAILFNWAKQSHIKLDELQQSLKVTILIDSQKKFESIRILDEDITIYCDNKIILETSFIQSLTLHNTRFVPHYSYEEWAEPLKPTADHEPIDQIMHTLGEHITQLQLDH